MRGDAALAILQALETSLVAQHKALAEIIDTVRETIAKTDEFDKRTGLRVGDRADPQSEMLKVLRQQMPTLANLSDEEIIAKFGVKA